MLRVKGQMKGRVGCHVMQRHDLAAVARMDAMKVDRQTGIKTSPGSITQHG
jgi:hypothetical protein